MSISGNKFTTVVWYVIVWRGYACVRREIIWKNSVPCALFYCSTHSHHIHMAINEEHLFLEKKIYIRCHDLSFLKLNIHKTKITAFNPIISWQKVGGKCKHWQTLFSRAPKSLQIVNEAMKLKDACSLEEKLWQT